MRKQGLPKMHKSLSFVPSFSPIISSCSTYKYPCVKFLRDLLSAHILQQYAAKDSISFVTEVCKVNSTGKYGLPPLVCLAGF